MLNFDEKVILEDYKKALKSYYKNKVIDLDQALSKKLECSLVRLENIFQQVTHNIPPIRQSRFSIIYIVKGDGKKIIGSITIPIKDHTLMVVRSKVISSSIYTSLRKGYNLAFNLSFFLQEQFPKHHLLNMNLFNPHLIPYAYPKIKWGKVLEEIFETLLEEGTHQRKNREQLIALKLLELMIVCDRLFKTKEPQVKNYHPPLLVQYIDLIQEHYKYQHSPSYYAKKLHVHPNSLNATVKRYLDQSAKATIDSKLISESQYLLNQTTLSVKEIAYELGFHSPSHFFRFFKRHTNQSPAEYRRQPFEFVLN